MIGLYHTPPKVPKLSAATLSLQRILLALTFITAVIEINLVSDDGFLCHSFLAEFNFTSTLVLFLVYFHTAFLTFCMRDNYGWAQLLSLPAALILIVENGLFYGERCMDSETWDLYQYLSMVHITVGVLVLVEIYQVSKACYVFLEDQGIGSKALVYNDENDDEEETNKEAFFDDDAGALAVIAVTRTVDGMDGRWEDALEFMRAQQVQILQLTYLTESLIRL